MSVIERARRSRAHRLLDEILERFVVEVVLLPFWLLLARQELPELHLSRNVLCTGQRFSGIHVTLLRLSKDKKLAAETFTKKC